MYRGYTALLPALILIVSSLSLTASAGNVSSAGVSSKVPFETGEQLVYKLKWGLIPAGKATLKVLPSKSFNGQTTYHVTLRAKTTGLMAAVYGFQTSVESFIDTSLQRSHLYQKRCDEGSGKDNFSLTFDWKRNEAVYRKNQAKARTVAIKPGTLDPLAMVYAVRARKLTVGKRVHMRFTNGKAYKTGEAKVTRKEEIKTKAGTFETVVVEPLVKKVGSIFKGKKRSSLTLWFSNDHRQIPVRFTGKIMIGKLVGELVRVTPTSF